jgi:hypothetical protein
MADAALGHPDALGEYLLSDFEFTHLGLDQFNPFIHVRHDTWVPPAVKTQLVVFKFSSQIHFVLGLFHGYESITELAITMTINMPHPGHDLPDMPIDTTFTSPEGSAAAQRALDYYLKPPVSEEPAETHFFDVNRNVSSEEALIHASELLSCAAATAYESGNNLQGANRHLAFSTVHMIDMAKALVDRSLECVKNG